MMNDEDWNPSWDKGAIDVFVIDSLVFARQALTEITGNGHYPNVEQKEKILEEIELLKVCL
jgi:hypothetical protein